MTIAPLLIDWEPFLIALGILVLLATFAIFVRAIARALGGDIPVIGNIIHFGVAQFEDYVSQKLHDALSGVEDRFASFLGGMETLATDGASAINAFADKTLEAFDYLTHTTVHVIIKDFLTPVHNEIEKLTSEVATLNTDMYTTVKGDAMRAAEWVTNIGSTAADRIDDLWNNEFPRIQDKLRDFGTQLGTTIPRAFDDVRGEIKNLGSNLGEIIDNVTPKEIIGAVAAVGSLSAIMAARVIPSIETVERCAPKIRAACTIDESLIESLVNDALPILEIAAIVEIVRLSQQVAKETIPVLRAIHR